jgi:hypothetical protein
MLDLKLLEDNLNTALDNETPESLTQFILLQRVKGLIYNNNLSSNHFVTILNKALEITNADNKQLEELLNFVNNYVK